MKPIYRKIPHQQDDSFRFRRVKSQTINDTWHFHPELEIIYIYKGTGIALIGDGIEQFKPGDLFLLGENLPHLFKSDAIYFESSNNLDVEAIAIHFFPNALLGKDFMELPENRTFLRFIEKSRKGLKFKASAAIERTISKIESHQNLGKIGHFILLLDQITGLNLPNTISDFINVSSLDDSNKHRMDKIFSYTLNNFSNEITIKELADLVNLNRNSFCRYFKNNAKKSYFDFLQEIRIGHACKLLLNDQFSISRVALESGYNTIANFNRQFLKIKKMTPSKYKADWLSK